MRRKFDLTKLRHSRRPSNLPPILLIYLLGPRQLLDGQRDSADRPNSSSQRFWMLRGPNYGLSACHLPIPSRTPCHIPMLEGHRSHPRHSQLSELHSREWDGGVRLLPDQRANAGKRRKRVRFSNESEERKGAATAEQQNTDALEILFAVGMPIYRVPSTPSGYHPTTWLLVRMYRAPSPPLSACLK